MKRQDIINHLIRFHGYRTYLEVGTAGGYCFSRVECERKWSVDPAPGSYDFNMTSDEFFLRNAMVFDLIFIDGWHSAFFR